MEIISRLFHRLTSFGDPIDVAVNIATVVGWLWLLLSATKTWIRYRRRRKILKFTSSSKGRVAISIGVGLNPEKAVSEFLRENFPDVALVMTYSRLGDFSGKELLETFEQIKSDFFGLMERGDISEVLLFYGGPVTLMAPIGAVLDNWVPVRLFGRNNEGKYIFHFTLNRQLVKAIPLKDRKG